MVFDPARRRSVLFGGSTGTASDETWSWDGSRWTLVARAPGRRFNPAMAYDATTGRIVVFGGWNGSTRLGDLMELRDDAWQSLSAQGPSPRNHATVTYDTRRRRLLLFGGHDGQRVFGDMWAFGGGSWRELMSMPPASRVTNGH
jgi:hypothetical protein